MNYPIPTLTEAAYIAGIIDGEGSLVMQHRGRRGWSVGLRVGNCDKPLIDWLYRFGGFCLWNRNQGVPNRRPHHEWHMTGNHLRRILPPVLPFLIIKKEKAEWVTRVLEIQAEWMSRSGHDGNPTHVRYSPETLAELEEIHQRFVTDRQTRVAARLSGA